MTVNGAIFTIAAQFINGVVKTTTKVQLRSTYTWFLSEKAQTDLYNTIVHKAPMTELLLRL